MEERKIKWSIRLVEQLLRHRASLESDKLEVQALAKLAYDMDIALMLMLTQD